MDDSVYPAAVLPARQKAPLAEEIPCGIFRMVLDERMSLLYGNEYFYRCFGYSAEAAAKEGFDNCRFILEGDEYSRVLQEMRGHIAHGQYHFELENRCVTRSREQIWVLVRAVYDPEEGTMLGAVFNITDRKRAEEALRISEEENRIAIGQSGKIICRYDIRSRTLSLPEGAARMLGTGPVVPDAFNHFAACGAVAPECAADCRRFADQMHAGQDKGSGTFRMWNSEKGCFCWYHVDYTLVCDDKGEPASAILSYYDCTDLHEKEVAYRRWRQTYEEKVKDCISYYEFNLTDDICGRLEGQVATQIPEALRASFSQITDYAAEHFVHPEDRRKYEQALDRKALLRKHREGVHELCCEHRRYDERGLVRWALLEIQMIDDPFSDAVRAFVLIKSIDEEKRRQLQMKQLSQSDPLTGIYNRRALISHLSPLLRRDGEGQHAFVILDIDHFKELNDTQGHQAGDQALIEVARGLQAGLHGGDLCGRLGGDEFLIFLRDVLSDEDVHLRLDALRVSLMQPSRQYRLSGSFGVARFPQDGLNFRLLYQKADLALYEAKRRGRDQVVQYREIER
ncbi:sensor domain-containing diguanylate cyclase [Harryflintia acetispora]|uniref:PAS domain S-box-containing protein/diguanylate cyclase (GGDEF)-like protein n=1 Tax=Harryflintia acetispora TaxID=1849041 RepID=A0A9X8UH44_9FIRM|nr:sensor domain-containing diguanylate cyclase [Harryflintia acetispora]TCL41586.1 PAS domain S-box-containing protein/diguanylate cyclase (GGDEF)-like protein [Harryflintia acetispora]